MKLKTVTYTAKRETYNDNNESIALTAELSPGDGYEDVLEELKTKVHAELKEYEQLVSFLTAQGLKGNFPEFPSFEEWEVKVLQSSNDSWKLLVTHEWTSKHIFCRRSLNRQ